MMLELRDFSLYHQDRSLLHSIHIHIPEPCNVGLVGESGSGKTSLLRSLIRLFDSSYCLKAQSFQVLGENVLKLSPKALRAFRKKVAFVSADIYGSFFPLSDVGTVFNAILTAPNKSLKKQRAFTVMDRLGLTNLDLIWHSYIRELSGGMARRVQLALALASGAEMLICDELSSSLDAENLSLLLDLLLEFKLPLILSTHQSKTLDICQKILHIHQGKLC